MLNSDSTMIDLYVEISTTVYFYEYVLCQSRSIKTNHSFSFGMIYNGSTDRAVLRFRSKWFKNVKNFYADFGIKFRQSRFRQRSTFGCRLFMYFK